MTSIHTALVDSGIDEKTADILVGLMYVDPLIRASFQAWDSGGRLISLPQALAMTLIAYHKTQQKLEKRVVEFLENKQPTRFLP